MTDKTIDHRLAWLAGIIDGEGWIGFRLETNSPYDKARRSGKSFVGTGWHVAVANTDAAMLAEIMSIADVIGARFLYYGMTKKDRRPNRKLQGRVTFHTKASCRAILMSVYPYLINKRPQADIMLRALSRREGMPHYKKPGYLPVMQDAEFLTLLGEMKALNRRGTNTPVGDDTCRG